MLSVLNGKGKNPCMLSYDLLIHNSCKVKANCQL